MTQILYENELLIIHLPIDLDSLFKNLSQTLQFFYVIKNFFCIKLLNVRRYCSTFFKHYI